MDDANVPAVECRVRLPSPLEREGVRGEEGEWKLGEEGPRGLEPAPPIPADGPAADRRDLAASDLEAPAVELGPERESDRLRPVPGRDDRDALRREERETLAEDIRVSRGLNDDVGAAFPGRSADRVAELCRASPPRVHTPGRLPGATASDRCRGRARRFA